MKEEKKEVKKPEKKDKDELPEGLTKKQIYDIVKAKLDEHGLTGALAKQEKRAAEAERQAAEVRRQAAEQEKRVQEVAAFNAEMAD